MKEKKLKDVQYSLIQDRSELGQQLTSKMGIAGLLKYKVVLDFQNPEEGKEFQNWDQFSDIEE